MKLQSLQIKNYRNFIDSGVIPYHDMTIFVGENGSGKTSTIDALTLLIEYGTPKPVRDDLIDTTLPVEIEGVFYIPSSDTELPIEKYYIDRKLTLRYVFDVDTGTIQYSIKCTKYIDDKYNTYALLQAESLKEFVRSLNMTPHSTKHGNYELIQNHIATTLPDTTLGYVDISWSEISAYVPLLQRYSSGDYSRPESIVRKTLDTIYRTHFYELDEHTGEEKLKAEFSELRTQITQDLNQNINNQLKESLSRHLDNIGTVGGEYSIDFTKGLALAGVVITFTDGSRKSIDQLGEGHKKKAALAVLEWDAEVSRSTDERNVIKAYDEPDANLDFTAQRKIFTTINMDAHDNEHVSAIICTHSLALIDRAPAESINRIHLDGRGATVEYLHANDDEGIKQFLSQVAEVSGLRNSDIFYEKAFLVVEGESEEASMGLLYKTYAGRTMPEDGIVLINIRTNGQWNNILKFLSANKSACTILLLDSDTQQSGSTRQVTTQKLQDSGFDASFLSNHCFFIGSKEFEDTYSDEDLALMANQKFPKSDGSTWSDTDFAALRALDKFSYEVSRLISTTHRGQATKPMIAYEMASLYDRTKISQNTVLRDLFEKINSIISS